MGGWGSKRKGETVTPKANSDFSSKTDEAGLCVLECWRGQWSARHKLSAIGAEGLTPIILFFSSKAQISWDSIVRVSKSSGQATVGLRFGFFRGSLTRHLWASNCAFQPLCFILFMLLARLLRAALRLLQGDKKSRGKSRARGLM